MYRPRHEIYILRKSIPSAMTVRLQRNWPFCLVDSMPTQARFILEYQEGFWRLLDKENPQFAPLQLGLSKLILRHKKNQYSRKTDPMAKALGLNKLKESDLASYKVLEPMGGVGKDSALILSFGVELVTAEREAALAFLLEQEQLQLENILWSVTQQDFLQAREMRNYFDVVYLDPMYPEQIGRTALPNKEMQILKDLVGPSEDDFQLLEKARAMAKRRVVVKRPLKAEGIAPDFDFSIKGKSTRYDVYLL